MKLTVYGKPDCPDFARVADILAERAINFEFEDVTAGPEIAQLARELAKSDRTPVVIFSASDVLVEPSSEELAARIDAIGSGV